MDVFYFELVDIIVYYVSCFIFYFQLIIIAIITSVDIVIDKFNGIQDELNCIFDIIYYYGNIKAYSRSGALKKIFWYEEENDSFVYVA